MNTRPELVWRNLDISDLENFSWEIKEHINYLTYPCATMNIAQRHDGTYSHAGNQAGDVKDYPIDEGCDAPHPDRSWMYCPCDEMVVLRVRGVDTGNDEPGKANVIWLKSKDKVVTPHGEDNIVLMVIHPNDDDLSKIYVGDVFSRGQAMFREGTDAGGGKTVAAHFHMAVSTGNIIESNSGLGEYQSTYYSPETASTWNIIILETDGTPLEPDEAFYVNTNFTTIVDSKNYEFDTTTTTSYFS